MSFPLHPDTIVLRNSFYPKGLREVDIYNFYQRNKNKIIKEINGRPVLIFMLMENGEYIVKRKEGGKVFTLDNTNYDRILSGRSISLSVEIGKSSPYICIDIDAGYRASEAEKKECVKYLLSSPIQELMIFDHHRIVSSATGYHVYFYLKVSKLTNTLMSQTSMALAADPKRKWKIAKQAGDNEIVLDMSPMYPRGSHTVPGGLCRNGLIALDITNNLDDFKRTNAIIKKEWSQQVKTKESTYAEHEGLYKRPAEEIVNTLLSHTDDPVTALRRLIFVMNRAGSSLTPERRNELEKAKKILKQKVKEYRYGI
jgi:hypothetical protein